MYHGKIMNITILNDQATYCLQIQGDLDASSSIQFDETIQKIIEEGGQNLLFDCRQLNYISSAGLGVFMSYVRDFENKKINHVIFGLSEKVKGVFEILGLDKLLTIVKTKEEASVLANGLQL